MLTQLWHILYRKLYEQVIYVMDLIELSSFQFVYTRIFMYYIFIQFRFSEEIRWILIQLLRSALHATFWY